MSGGARLDFDSTKPYEIYLGGARLDFDWTPAPNYQASLGGQLLTVGGSIEGSYRIPYYAALGGQLLTFGGGFEAGYDINVWRGLQQARGDDYQDGARLTRRVKDEWRSAARIEALGGDAWQPAAPLWRQTTDGWASMAQFRRAVRDEWRHGRPLQAAARDSYIYMSALRRFWADDWQHGVPLATLTTDGYLDLPRYWRVSSFAWEQGRPLARMLMDDWGEGLPIRVLTPDEWHDGRYLLPGKTPWPERKPRPPEPIFRSARLDFGLVLWTPVTPRLDFDARVQFPIRIYYLIMTSAYIVRLPDRKPLPVSRISIAYDWDSWECRISATLLGKRAYTDAMAAAEIEIDINGHKRRARLDKITGDRSFASHNYTLTASSRAAELAPPIAQTLTWYNANTRTMAQLADAALDGTGWTVTWGAQDWIVAPRLWSTQSAPINALSRLAEAAGAYVLPHPVDKTIAILPRYAFMPWNWSEEELVIIPSSITRQFSWEPVELAPYNAVYVAGETNGVLGHCVLDGTAGDIVAPMVTDALICAPDAARARGRAILAETGAWTHCRLQLPIEPLGGDIPLLEIGALISFLDAPLNEQWPGLVTGMNITAQWQNGLRLTQELYVRRWHG